MKQLHDIILKDTTRTCATGDQWLQTRGVLLQLEQQLQYQTAAEAEYAQVVETLTAARAGHFESEDDRNILED